MIFLLSLTILLIAGLRGQWNLSLLEELKFLQCWLRRWLFVGGALVMCWTGNMPCNKLLAKEWQSNFDQAKVTWQLEAIGTGRLVGQARLKHPGSLTDGYEQFQLVGNRSGQNVQVYHPLPLAHLVDGLEVKLKLKASRAGAQLALRVVFPHQLDPQTGAPYTRIYTGGEYTTAGNWQEIRCRIEPALFAQKIQFWKAQFRPRQLNTEKIFVDRVYLIQPVDQREVVYQVDQLNMTEWVEYHASPVDTHAETSLVTPPAAPLATRPSPVEFRLDRMLVEERPFFPFILPYQGAPASVLKAMGANVVFVPDYQDLALLQELRAENLWATAYPPARSRLEDPVEVDRLISPSVTGLQGAGFQQQGDSQFSWGPETETILFWNCGTAIPSHKQADLIAWVEKIRQQDQLQRPIWADLQGGEAALSMDLSLVGESRHVLHSPVSFEEQYQYLLQKSYQTRPGAFLTTWIQAEPNPVLSQRREQLGLPSLWVEPEQLRAQFYLALRAGCRGVGFWTTATGITAAGEKKSEPIVDREEVSSIFQGVVGEKLLHNSNKEVLNEQALAIRQLAIEADLLEPFLATGKLVNQVSIHRQVMINRLRGAVEWPFRSQQEEALSQGPIIGQASVLMCDYGLLILPQLLGDRSQYVPDQLFAQNAALMIRGVAESATVWELTPTGIFALEHERVAGGTRIHLKRLDQTSAILVLSDQHFIQKIQARLRPLKEKAATTAVDLAKVKLKRVEQVSLELEQTGGAVPLTADLLAAAESQTLEAEAALAQQSYHEARLQASDAMRVLRTLQRTQWQYAVQKYGLPASSEQTLCYQTLPEFWRQLDQLSQRTLTPNLLPSGNFNYLADWQNAGWQVKAELPQQATVTLHSEAYDGPASLRLTYLDSKAVSQKIISARGQLSEVGETVTSVNGRRQATGVRLVSPALKVQPGDWVQVVGRFRVKELNPGTEWQIWDTETKAAGMLRYTKEAVWEKFELIREVSPAVNSATGPAPLFQLAFCLTGPGDVLLDEVQVRVHRVGISPETPVLSPDTAEEEADGRWPRWANPFGQPWKPQPWKPWGNFRKGEKDGAEEHETAEEQQAKEESKLSAGTTPMTTPVATPIP